MLLYIERRVKLNLINVTICKVHCCFPKGNLQLRYGNLKVTMGL